MSNIDEKAKDNFTIEMRIFENYEKVKHEIIKVIDFLRHAGTNLGMFYSLASLCVVSWYALNVCVGKFLVCVQGFLGMPLIRELKNARY